MATCKSCGKPFIPKGGRCIYCGADSRGIQKKKENLLVKKTIDIVFCIDCSWPMAPVLDSVKDNVIHLLEEIDQYNKETTVVVDWQARVVGYRNFLDDSEHLLNDNQFVSDIEAVKSQLAGIVCKGYSENSPYTSSLDALWYSVETTKWRNWKSDYPEDYLGGYGRHSFLLLFTASPTLPVHDNTVESVVGADYDIELLKKTLSEKHIALTIFGPDDSVFQALNPVPYSVLNLFEDPIEYYYHKRLDFSPIINSFNGTLS